MKKDMWFISKQMNQSADDVGEIDKVYLNKGINWPHRGSVWAEELFWDQRRQKHNAI